MGLFGRGKLPEVLAIEDEVKKLKEDRMREIMEIQAAKREGLLTDSTLTIESQDKPSYVMPARLPSSEEVVKQLAEITKQAKILEAIEEKSQDPKYQKALRSYLKMDRGKILVKGEELRSILKIRVKAITLWIEQRQEVLQRWNNPPEKEKQELEHFNREKNFLQQILRDLEKLLYTVRQIMGIANQAY